MPINVIRKSILVKCFCVTITLVGCVNNQTKAEPIQNRNNTQQQPANVQATVSPIPQPSVKPSESELTDTKTNHQEQSAARSMEFWLVIFSALAFVALVGHFVVFLKQLSVMRGLKTLAEGDGKILAKQASALEKQALHLGNQTTTLDRQAKTLEFQTGAMQGQLSAMQRQVAQNERMIKTNQGQHKVMQDQLKLSTSEVDAMKLAERAYIGIKSAKLCDFEIGKVPYIEIRFLNGGRTPAWNFYAPATLSADTQPPQNVPPKPTDENGGFVPAGEIVRSPYPAPTFLTPEVYNQISSGAITLFLKGEMWFDDCWEKNRMEPFHLIYRPTDGAFFDFKRYAQFIDISTEKGAPGTKRPAY